MSTDPFPPRRMPSQQGFNPYSLDATLATLLANQKNNSDAVLARLSQQDEVLKVIRAEAAEIKVEVKKTNGRVTLLERLWDNLKIRIATVVTGLGILGGLIGWLVQNLLK